MPKESNGTPGPPSFARYTALLSKIRNRIADIQLAAPIGDVLLGKRIAAALEMLDDEFAAVVEAETETIREADAFELEGLDERRNVL